MALGGVYETGTITISGDRITVTGVGTLWGPVAEVGDWILCNGQTGLVRTVSDDTHLILQSQWQGTLPAAATYVLIKSSWLRYDPALTQAKLRELLADLDAQGIFHFTETDPPDPALGQDGQWALKTNDQPWVLWHKEGGVWVPQPTPAGLDWKGAWSAATTYSEADGVSRLGSSYVSKTTNINQPPESNPDDWDLFAGGGAVGPIGPPGMVWRGPWNSATAYVVNDGVSLTGSSYIAVAPNTNSMPPSANWNLMAAGGSAAIAPDSVTPPMLDAGTAAKQLAFRDRIKAFVAGVIAVSSSPLTLTAADSGKLIENVSASSIVNLPAPAPGLHLTFVTWGGTTTVNGTGGSVIFLPDGVVAGSTVIPDHGYLMLICDSSNWLTVGSGYHTVAKTGDTMTGALNITNPNPYLILNTTDAAAGAANVVFQENGVSKAYLQWVGSTFPTIGNRVRFGTNGAQSIEFHTNGQARMSLNGAGALLADGTITSGSSGTSGTYYFGNGTSKSLSHDGSNFSLVGGVFFTSGEIRAAGSLTANYNSAGGSLFFGNSFAKYLQYDSVNGCYELSGAGGAVKAGVGIQGRAGVFGGYVPGAYNIEFRSGSMHLWIDPTDLGSINLTSDYRIKKDVVDLPSTWEIVKALRPIKYTQAQFTPPSHVKYIAAEVLKARKEAEENPDAKPREISTAPLFPADDKERWGFIAHELQETMIMDAATAEKDAPAAIQSPNPWTIIAALTKTVQEMQARIEALEAPPS